MFLGVNFKWALLKNLRIGGKVMENIRFSGR